MDRKSSLACPYQGLGCEAFVRRETQDKLEPRNERCIFIGYPHKSFGYLFYIPSENVVFVARRGVFREKELIFKENSGSAIDIEEIPKLTSEVTLENTSSQPEDETPIGPIDNSLPFRRPNRVSMPPSFCGFHITSDGDTFFSDGTLVNLDEPTNYKEAMASLHAAKWKKAIDIKINPTYDNQVWNLVDHVPGRKTVRCKWIFKNNTNTDGNGHIFKAWLIAKGFTQTQGID